MRFQVLINKPERLLCRSGFFFFFLLAFKQSLARFFFFFFLPVFFDSPSLLHSVEPTSSVKWSSSIITTLTVSPALTERQEQTALRLFKWHTAYSVQTDVQSYGQRYKCVLEAVSTFSLAERQLRQMTGGGKCRYCSLSTGSPAAPPHRWKFSAGKLLQPPRRDAVCEPVRAVDFSLTWGRVHRRDSLSDFEPPCQRWHQVSTLAVGFEDNEDNEGWSPQSKYKVRLCWKAYPQTLEIWSEHVLPFCNSFIIFLD